VSKLFATLGAARRADSYISSEGKRIIFSCMRYWVVSIRFMLGPWRVRRRSKRVVSRLDGALESVVSFSAFGLEAVDLMVGGSCK